MGWVEGLGWRWVGGLWAGRSGGPRAALGALGFGALGLWGWGCGAGAVGLGL